MSMVHTVVAALEEGNLALADTSIRVYADSCEKVDHVKLVMIEEAGIKSIIAVGTGAMFDELDGESIAGGKQCPLSHGNRIVLNRYLPYTAPQAFGTEIATIGLGDRLGLASPGHIQAVRGRSVRPILAQQSIRELHLTGRDYKQVLDAACYAAFQEGYKDGFGADGDHLKVEADIQMSLDLGFTMLTLDCSEKIANDVLSLSEQEVQARYEALDYAIREHYEKTYLNQTFLIEGNEICYGRQQLMADVLIYGEAIDFMQRIYEIYIKTAARDIDFEISIDETLSTTSPEAHFLVAQELYLRGVAIYSMAPRFCGEFQKGIDYIGDIAQFEVEMKVHAAIADHFGYKLSIHSGSDKFSVFPIIAKYTKGRFHVKTAGTNWLEAVRTIARVNPSLYRRMYAYAVEHFSEALAYYHVKADLTAITPLDQTADADLPGYMDNDDARQLIHITYGILLQAVNEDGSRMFKDEFYAVLQEHAEAYNEALIQHIGRHLTLLGK